MSTRFSEFQNSSWCKTCNVQLLPGQEHPNEAAHMQETSEAELKSAALNAKLTATSSFIPVSSNDMMKHIALVSSPETLCGKIVVDDYRPSTTDRVCDTCAELSSEANFVKTEEENMLSISSFAKNKFASTPEEREEGRTIINGINSGNFCSRCTEILPKPGEPGKALCDDCKTYTGSINKQAVNYTRDGMKIEDGFTVITADEADVLPFLNTDKVKVARWSCPDCNDKTYFERIASCAGCGEFKCVACMNSIDNFLGICAKCANTDDLEILAGSFEEPLDSKETLGLRSHLWPEEEETDPFFLPQDEI